MRQMLENPGRKMLIGITLISIIVVSALILVIVREHRRESVRIAKLRLESYKSKERLRGSRIMQDFLGEEGIRILRSPVNVEVLGVGRGPDYPCTLTGVALDDEVANALCASLLDYRNYAFLDADDMPEPQTGFRFRNGSESIDILVSLEGSNENSPHIDIFAILIDSDGRQKYKGSKCMYSESMRNILFPLMPSKQGQEP